MTSERLPEKLALAYTGQQTQTDLWVKPSPLPAGVWLPDLSPTHPLPHCYDYLFFVP